MTTDRRLLQQVTSAMTIMNATPTPPPTMEIEEIQEIKCQYINYRAMSNEYIQVMIYFNLFVCLLSLYPKVYAALLLPTTTVITMITTTVLASISLSSLFIHRA